MLYRISFYHFFALFAWISATFVVESACSSSSCKQRHDDCQLTSHTHKHFYFIFLLFFLFWRPESRLQLPGHIHNTYSWFEFQKWARLGLAHQTICHRKIWYWHFWGYMECPWISRKKKLDWFCLLCVPFILHCWQWRDALTPPHLVARDLISQHVVACALSLSITTWCDSNAQGASNQFNVHRERKINCAHNGIFIVRTDSIHLEISMCQFRCLCVKMVVECRVLILILSDVNHKTGMYLFRVVPSAHALQTSPSAFIILLSSFEIE